MALVFNVVFHKLHPAVGCDCAKTCRLKVFKYIGYVTYPSFVYTNIIYVCLHDKCSEFNF